MNITIKERETSLDYRRPYRPRLIAALNSAGRLMRSAGFESRLDPGRIAERAMRKAGFHDFGDESFRERLALLAQSIDEEARLHPVGRFMVRHNLIRFLVNRLRIEHAFKSHPEIKEVPIKEPVFIIGLQRTGTTMLHRILASDESRFRFLASWEAINPAPFPGVRAAGDADPRVKMAVTAHQAVKYLAPDFFAIHPVDPLGPEEDCLLFDFDFYSTVPEATMRVPTFSRWLEQQDHTAAYRYYRRILQYLSWQRPGGRWVLKTPQHMEHFEELFTVFPDATVIQTHRDPTRVVASFCSMVAHAYGVFSDEIDPCEIGAHWFRKAVKMVDHSMNARAKRKGRFLDVAYTDLIGDPVSVTRRIYGFLGIVFENNDASRVQDWIHRNPQHRYGKHRYRLEDFGLSPSTVAESFRPYRAMFDVPEEPSRE